jgi:serine/threonine protein kinase
VEAVSQLAPARIIGRYALYDRIASGGMATVHLGRLIGPVGFARTVAIKRLHPQFAEDPEFVSMFLDEARVAARIRHPNVVPTIDVVAIDNELFLVMEYVQGESLSRLMTVATGRQQRLPPALVSTIMTGVLHGLHAAHEARDERGMALDIVHRDVSPQNILVGVDGVPRVLDFGVAKAAGRLQSTRTGQLKGKLAYMAPEQIGGSVGRTTDVYAAAVVMWEALTSRRLFRGESEAEVMKQVLEGQVSPPSQLAPDIPPVLEAIVMRGLHMDPARRFQTAGEMALALEDSVPLVPASRIGQWVQSAAGEALTRRSERLAVIESDSALSRPSLTQPRAPDEPVSTTRPVPGSPVAAGPTPVPPGTAAVPADAAPAQEGTMVVSDDMFLHTQLSSGSVSVAGRGAVGAKPSRRGWLVAAAAVGGLLVGATILVAIVSRRSEPTTSAVPAAASAPVQPSAPEPSATTPGTVAPPTIAVDQLPPAAPASPQSAAPATSVATPPSPTPAPAPRPASAPRPNPPAAAAAPKNACDPPYYFDKDGTRVFKKECL